MEKHVLHKVHLKGRLPEHYHRLLTPEALNFLTTLHKKFNPRRLELLQKREERQKQLNQGAHLSFLPETAHIRSDSTWQIAPTPQDLQCRWVEITGPTDRKMIINAMNSGADVFMADFEDANSPTWENMVEGQINLRDTINGAIDFESLDGKKYSLNKNHAVLLVRPRGWHLNEKHLTIEAEEISGSLFDFGLYLFHNGKKLLDKGSGPYYYLPKLESHLEARLWNDVFLFAQKELGIPQGSIKATVLIETIMAAFEMEEIVYELREHSAGLNAGRWDYMFSIIKKFRRNPLLHLPNRDQITMTVPFMRAYTQLLVKTCHKRGAHAIGGMAAFIPNRKDAEVTERALRKVREDKLREVGDGFDGTWVAHPDLVPIARKIFETTLKDKFHQKDILKKDVSVQANDLVSFTVPGGTITEEGVRHNINVGIQYLVSWLSGRGAAAIYNLMEDVATAEISRAQVWQWIQNKEKLEDGKEITVNMIGEFIKEEIEKIAKLYGNNCDKVILKTAQSVFEQLVFGDHFIEFLTIPAYQKLKDQETG